MRYIAIFLVLANLAYFGWNSYQPVPPVATAAPRPLLNSGLTLVSEYDREVENAGIESRRLYSVVSGFLSLEEPMEFMGLAQNQGFQVLLERPQARETSQFRVFLPPTPSIEIATLTISDLAERVAELEIEVETYLITRGELQNAVALGVFDSATAAVTLRDQIESLGYSPQIEEIQPLSDAVQVWLRPPDSERIDEPEWLDLTGERPHLTRVENLCQTIAQASQFQ